MKLYMQKDFKAEAEAMRADLVARRRKLHQHPELAFEETWTAALVAQELISLGMEVQVGVGRTGVVGLLEGAADGPTVLLRADMDALPVHEENDVPYVSGVPGKMHACGHDGHVTVGLAVARLLAERREQMHGRVKFVFQPAEEIGQGAQAMANEGVLDNPRPDVSLGLHLWNSLPLGVLGVAEGPVMAGSSTFELKIVGKGGHAAQPHMLIDPMVCAAQLITALQTIVSRGIDPLEGAVVSVTMLRAGETYNVIPQSAALRGTFRTFSVELRDRIGRRFRELADGICAAMGCHAELRITHDTAPVVNDGEVVARLRPVLNRIVGDSNIQPLRTMTAEDVSVFMTDIPGLFVFIGARDEQTDAYYGHHHPRFTFDEDALPLAVNVMTSAVAAYVLPEG